MVRDKGGDRKAYRAEKSRCPSRAKQLFQNLQCHMYPLQISIDRFDLLSLSAFQSIPTSQMQKREANRWGEALVGGFGGPPTWTAKKMKNASCG